MTTVANILGQPGYRLQPYDAVRVALGLLLLTAAGLKGYALATGPVGDEGLLTSRWFSILIVEAELLLGLWLLSGLRRQLVWWAAVVCFSTFASVALYQAISGFESCGCFGTIQLSPWYTFGLDVVAIAALLAFPPQCQAGSAAVYASAIRGSGDFDAGRRLTWRYGDGALQPANAQWGQIACPRGWRGCLGVGKLDQPVVSTPESHRRGASPC